MKTEQEIRKILAEFVAHKETLQPGHPDYVRDWIACDTSIAILKAVLNEN
jgi:hypothetical protein